MDFAVATFYGVQICVFMFVLQLQTPWVWLDYKKQGREQPKEALKPLCPCPSLTPAWKFEAE